MGAGGPFYDLFIAAVYSSSVSVAFYKTWRQYHIFSQNTVLDAGLRTDNYYCYTFTCRTEFTLHLQVFSYSSRLDFWCLHCFGVRVNEATRWIVIPGTGFRLQTSDVAKVALVIYLARALSQYQNELNNFMLMTKISCYRLQLSAVLFFPKTFQQP